MASHTHFEKASTTDKRRLILVDIENLCDEPALSAERVLLARKLADGLCGFTDRDLFVVGTSHHGNFLAAKLNWPKASHVLKFGHDGADLALIEAAKGFMPRVGTFDEVLLFSGDGIFSELVGEMSASGIPVTVISAAKSLSRRLAKTASSIRLIPGNTQLEPLLA